MSTSNVTPAFRFVGQTPRDTSLADFILPLIGGRASMGSTDVGDVSWTVPTVQALGATCAVGTQLHSWQMTAQGKSKIAHKGMVHVAKIMAATATDIICDKALLDAAKADHAERLKIQPYICPIPDDVGPDLQPVPVAV